MDVITIALLNNTATAFQPWRGSILAVDGNRACLRSFNISSRTMSVLAGSCGNAGFADGALMQARFHHPTDVAVREHDGSIFDYLPPRLGFDQHSGGNAGLTGYA